MIEVVVITRRLEWARYGVVTAAEESFLVMHDIAHGTHIVLNERKERVLWGTPGRKEIIAACAAALRSYDHEHISVSST